MSIYFQFGDGRQAQVASNSGWGDVVRFISSGDDCPEILMDLVKDGLAEPVSEFLSALEKLDRDDAKSDVQHTLEVIEQVLSSHGDQDDAVVVSDGMGPDE